MPTPAVNPNAATAAVLLNGDATRKAAKLGFSAAAAAKIDTNGDGKIAKDELVSAISRMDRPTQLKLEEATKAAAKGTPHGGLRTALTLANIGTMMGFFFSRVNSPIGIALGVTSMAGQIGAMLWDRNVRKAAEPTLFNAANPLFENIPKS